jgi:hypothetical protein
MPIWVDTKLPYFLPISRQNGSRTLPNYNFCRQFLQFFRGEKKEKPAGKKEGKPAGLLPSLSWGELSEAKDRPRSTMIKLDRPDTSVARINEFGI